MFINSINYFRAIAIIFIVAGHCFGASDFAYTNVLGETIYNLTSGGTSFFVFISGFLFHYIFYKKFIFNKFYRTKLKNVLLPYVLISLVPIIFLVFTGYTLNKSSEIYYVPVGGGWLNEYVVPFIKYYITGHGIVAYWYIPFIMIVFALSPLFINFIKLRLVNQIIISVILLVGAVIVHRPLYTTGLSVFQSVFYFTPVYMIGIICSQRKEWIYSKLKGKEWYILAFFISMALFQASIGEIGNYRKNPFQLQGIDLMLIQKIVFSLFFMVWLFRFEKQKLKFLDLIASCSFGIFFLHGLFLSIISVVKNYFGFSFQHNSFAVYCLVTAIVFTLSLYSTLLVKRVFPKHSRYLIGS